MSTNPTIFISANAAPKRRHFAVPAPLLAALAVSGSLASLRWHFFSFAETVERFRVVWACPIVQSLRDWLANSLVPHRLLLPLWEQL